MMVRWGQSVFAKNAWSKSLVSIFLSFVFWALIFLSRLAALTLSPPYLRFQR